MIRDGDVRVVQGNGTAEWLNINAVGLALLPVGTVRTKYPLRVVLDNDVNDPVVLPTVDMERGGGMFTAVRLVGAVPGDTFRLYYARTESDVRELSLLRDEGGVLYTRALPTPPEVIVTLDSRTDLAPWVNLTQAGTGAYYVTPDASWDFTFYPPVGYGAPQYEPYFSAMRAACEKPWDVRGFSHLLFEYQIGGNWAPMAQDASQEVGMGFTLELVGPAGGAAFETIPMGTVNNFHGQETPTPASYTGTQGSILVGIGADSRTTHSAKVQGSACGVRLRMNLDTHGDAFYFRDSPFYHPAPASYWMRLTLSGW